MSAPAPTTETKSAGPKLHYFGLNGRGDFVKVLFEDAAAPYTFVPYGLGAHKSLTILPYGQLPVLEDSCGNVTAQTATIVRTVAKRLNQYPSNPVDASRAESVSEQCYDVVGKIFGHMFGNNPTADDLKTYLTTQYGYFEAILAKSESKGEYVNKTHSFADLELGHLVTLTIAFGNPPREGSLLAAHNARYKARPNIAAYLASSRWIKPGMPAKKDH